MSKLANIDYHLRTEKSNQKFSILIPSWNNLPYLQLCVKSIREQSSFLHQIIIHINEGEDGSLEWVRQQKDIDYTYSSTNIGVCYALNAAQTLAYTDYILYMNDDMFACKDWDHYLWNEIELIGNDSFFISATAIEKYPQSKCSIQGDFGSSWENFEEQRLLSSYNQFPMCDWMGATWPPNVVHKRVWNLVGGYSTEFSPGMYSDPDFSMKLWVAGIRYFKGVGSSRVYHFGSKSVNRITKNRGYYEFISKWGLTARTFSKEYLKRGEKFSNAAPDFKKSTLVRFKGYLKQFQAIFKR